MIGFNNQQCEVGRLEVVDAETIVVALTVNLGVGLCDSLGVLGQQIRQEVRIWQTTLTAEMELERDAWVRYTAANQHLPDNRWPPFRAPQRSEPSLSRRTVKALKGRKVDVYLHPDDGVGEGSAVQLVGVVSRAPTITVDGADVSMAFRVRAMVTPERRNDLCDLVCAAVRIESAQLDLPLVSGVA